MAELGSGRSKDQAGTRIRQELGSGKRYVGSGRS
jgi:hypothetical protein